MGISMWQLLIVLLIIVLLFGTKKLKSLGGDLGSAVKGFKKAIGDGEAEATDTQPTKELPGTQEKVIDAGAEKSEETAANKTNV